MSAKKYKGDSRNFTIIILIFLVIVQGFIIYSLRSPQKKSVRPKHVAKKIVFPKTIQPTAPIPVPEVPVPPLPPSPKVITGRVAIIIDDWGYGDHCSALKEIPGTVAVSVLPELPYSKAMAECAHKNGKEVMLHLPMEPHKNLEHYPENYILKTTTPRSDVEAAVNKALKTIPWIVGLNNHMGSKATESRVFMRILFSILKEKDLFFVDSVVTDISVCPFVARKVGISFGQRDIFLDNENNRDYIANQFAQLVKRARKKGYAIGIGHARSLTLEVIKEQMLLFQKQGIEFITVNDLIRTK